MRKVKSVDHSKKLCDSIIEGMQGNKAQNIVLLDLREISSAVCDYFVICTGESTVQVDGIASSVARQTRTELKEKPWHIEGKQNSDWVLLDYINVVVHIFYKDARSHYDLEDMWADAVRTDIPDLN